MCTDEQHTHKITLLESIDRSLSLHRTQPFIDDTVSISATQPFIVDRKGRKFLYIWSAISFTATIEDLGTLTVPSNVWVSCGFAEGMRLVPSASVTVYVRATDNIIGSALNNLTGNRTSAYSTPVTIASDQAPIPTTATISGNVNAITSGAFTEVTGLSAAALNADLVPATDVSAYRQVAIQVAGVWSGTLAFQVSNDNITFFSFTLANTFPTVTPQQTFTTGNGMYFGALGYRYLRVRMTGYSSGTATAVMELYTTPTIPTNQFVQALQSGLWTIGATASTNGTNDFHLISAASTNATVIKASAGQIYGFSLYNTNVAARYVKLYNKTTAPTVGTDIPVRTIGVPPLGSVHLSTALGIPCPLGIGLATTVGIADTDVAAVGLSDLAIDIDWK